MKSSVKSSIKKQIRIHLLGLSAVFTAMGFNACSTMKPIEIDNQSKEVQSQTSPANESKPKAKVGARSPAGKLLSDGKEGGNGGGNIEVDFMTYGMKFHKFLLTDTGKKLFPEIDAALFEQAIKQAELEVVKKKIKDRDGKLKTSRNIRIGNDILIEVSRSAWRKDTEKPLTQMKHAIHEYMGSVGIGGEEERLQYALTQRIDSETGMKILTGSQPVVTVLNPLDANEALMAEKESQLQQLEDDRLAVENPNESLNKAITIAATPTLRCVESIWKKRLGGKLGPDYMFDILKKLKAVKNEVKTEEQLVLFQEVKQYCEDIKIGLRKSQSSRQDLVSYVASKIETVQADDRKIYGTIFRWIWPGVVHCHSYSAEFNTSLLLGAKAGVAATDCIMTNGKRWIGFGPSVGYTIGFGASAALIKAEAGGREFDSDPENGTHTVGKVDYLNVSRTPIVIHSESVTNTIGQAKVMVFDESSWYEIANSIHKTTCKIFSPVGANASACENLEGKKSSHKGMRSIKAGMQLELQGKKISLEIPFLPLKRDWSILLKQL